MASKISKFLSSYDAKMPADGVPATLLRRLDFLTPVAELQNTKPKRWSFTLNAAIVVSTVLVSSYAFYKLGETGSYVLLVPPTQQSEIIPPEIKSYLDTDATIYLEWSIYSKTYFDDKDLKFYLGRIDADYFLYFYFDTNTLVDLHLASEEISIDYAASLSEVTIGKFPIENHENAYIHISVVENETTSESDYFFRIPLYLKLFEN